MKIIKLQSGHEKKSGYQESEKKPSNAASDVLRRRELKVKVDHTVVLLEYILSKIETLNFENFDILFPTLISKMQEATMLKEELISELGIERLTRICPKIFNNAKLIEKNYINIIEKFNTETEKLGKELATISNQKRILNYVQ